MLYPEYKIIRIYFIDDKKNITPHILKKNNLFALFKKRIPEKGFFEETLKGLFSFLSSLVGKLGVKRTDTEVLAPLPPISTIGKPRESTNCSSWSWKVSWHLRQLQQTIRPRQGQGQGPFLVVVQPNISHHQPAKLERTKCSSWTKTWPWKDSWSIMSHESWWQWILW